MPLSRGWLILVLTASLYAQPADRGLLLVSIDGLKPEYVTDPAHAAIRIPNLRRLMAQGVYASGVRGVAPSSTYPSHTTIMTGTHPAKHGIYSNKPFDPAGKNPNEWYWYSEDIAVPTLWDAASRSGYVTGSVSWPVTVGARSIAFNIPEYAGTRSDADIRMVRALAGPGLFDELSKVAGPYLTDVDQALERDWARTKFSVELIRQKRTRFLTVHLAALDHEQHEHGPFTPGAATTLEAIDRMLGTIANAMRALAPGAAICVVSDHGFALVDHVLNLDAAFVRAGLITLNTKGSSLQSSNITAWEAMPWHGGGSAAVVLREPTDAIRAKVRHLLQDLASDPANGIAAILEGPEIARVGGTSTAAFWVDMRPGFSVATALDSPLASRIKPRGTHGYIPTHKEMNSSFFLEGAGVRKNVNLGEIDMRAIAPTLATVLGIPFTTADAAALSVVEKAH